MANKYVINFTAVRENASQKYIISISPQLQWLSLAKIIDKSLRVWSVRKRLFYTGGGCIDDYSHHGNKFSSFPRY